MTLKIFTQPSCPSCPKAKELGKKFAKEIAVEYFDVSQPKGLAEATYYGIMSTPTLILTDGNGQLKKTFVGVPKETELYYALEIKRKAS